VRVLASGGFTAEYTVTAEVGKAVELSVQA